jgi:integrase
MAKKRANREGSIHKLPSGHWRGQVSHNGHRLSKTFPTQRECIDWVRKNLNQISDGLSYASTQLTLSEYMDGWLTNKKATRRYATWLHYDWLVKRYINPDLGIIKLKDLRADHIQGLINDLLKSRAGIYTVRKIRDVLHCALELAVRQEVLIRNPVDLVDPPPKPHKEMTILTESQVSQLLVAAKSHRLEALLHLTITTGVRESEVLALKWSDLDWTKGTLKVERQLERPRGEGVQFSAPKTAFGKRSIKLGSKTIELLRRHSKRQQDERIAAGETWKEYDLIFPTSVGTPIDQRSLLRTFKLFLKHAGLPPIRFHDLRHTSASLMLNHDIPVIIVSRRLGHARASITSDVYGHLLPNMQDEAAEMIDDLVTPTEVNLEDHVQVS